MSMLFPVVERELRVAARRRGTYRIRVLALLAAIIVFAWLIFVVGQKQLFPATGGQDFFEGVAFSTAIFSLLTGMFATSDCIGSEKREGTLGLLFLTDLKPFDVVLGKLVANSLNGFYAVVAVLPVLGVPILFGGVTFSQFLRANLALLTAVVFSLSAGIFVSSIQHNSRKAMFFTFILLLSLSIGPILLSIITDVVAFGLVSPILPVFVAIDDAPVATYYWVSLTIESLLIVFFLARAAYWVPVSLREKPVNPVQDRISQRRSRARPSDRRLLDINPFAWLAARSEADPGLVWFFIVCVVLVFWALTPTRMIFDGQVALWLDYCINTVLKIWIVSEASRRLAEDRRSGALELLLTTPLTERQIIRGQWLVLWNRFGLPILALLAGDLCLGTAIRVHTTGFVYDHLVLAFFLATDAVALSLMGMWLGLVTGNWIRTILLNLLAVMIVPWLATQAFMEWIAPTTFLTTPHLRELAELARDQALCHFFVWAVADLIIIVWSLSALRGSFRRIATRGL
ncbi:MAG TPA: ABC transporter permease [Verrucomicrobiae bacterium]